MPPLRYACKDGAPRNTRGVQRPVPQAPPSQHVAPLQTSTSFEQSNRDLVTSTNLSPSDGLFDMEDVQNMTGLVAEYSFPNDFVDTQESSWLDQAIVEMNAQAFNHSSASSNNASMDQPTNSSETTNIVCGLTGDMDPYLMQRYNFGPDHNFVFKRLAVRSMTQDIHPVQLLVSAAPDTTGADRLDGEKDPLRIQLEQLVSPDVGARLIALYGTANHGQDQGRLTIVDCTNLCTLTYQYFHLYSGQTLSFRSHHFLQQYI
jgi:hypothetical protein